MAGMDPLLEGLRASPDILWKKQCSSSQFQRWVESPEARTQRRDIHIGKFHLPCLEIFPRGLSFGLTYYLVGFIFGLGGLLLLFVF